MNFRQTLSSSKYNGKIKLTKTSQMGYRRLQTQTNQVSSYIPKKVQLISSTNRTQYQKKELTIRPQKYLQVYSKTNAQNQSQLINPSNNSNRKTFKVHANKPFILNKIVRTQADQQQNYNQATYQQSSMVSHQRKVSQLDKSHLQNKYEIDGVAGKGTFGTVFYGHLKGTGKKVAIKKVLQDKRYKNRQLQILKTLHHTNLLQMRDHYMSTQGQSEYLNVVMDYFPQNLYQCIKKKPMNQSLIKIFIYQILRGLMYMDMCSISHRDMKPHNVLVNSQTNKVVICDFGSAKQLVKGQPNLAYICSRCYRAPELIFGATDYTCQIDMWSTGCILIEMINGEPPFLGDSQIDQLIEIIKVMGTPSKQQEYDAKQYAKFPNVKKTEWKHILKTKDPLLLDLVSRIMQYSPLKRLSPEGALCHQYFSDLRSQDSYKQLHEKVRTIPQLFDFTTQQIQRLKHPQLLIPKWVDTNHTSSLSNKYREFSQGRFQVEIGRKDKINYMQGSHQQTSQLQGHNQYQQGHNQYQQGNHVQSNHVPNNHIQNNHGTTGLIKQYQAHSYTMSTGVNQQQQQQPRKSYLNHKKG